MDNVKAISSGSTGLDKISSGVTATLTNCLPGTYNPFTGYSYTASFYYPYQIRAVSNDFIVMANGQEHVFASVEGLVKFIEKNLTSEKKK